MNKESIEEATPYVQIAQVGAQDESAANTHILCQVCAWSRPINHLAATASL